MAEVVQKLSGHVNVWTRYVVPLAKYNFVNSFKFQFVAQAGLGPIGDIAVDDVSLSPECFEEGVFNEYPQFKQPLLPTISPPLGTMATSSRADGTWRKQ